MSKKPPKYAYEYDIKISDLNSSLSDFIQQIELLHKFYKDRFIDYETIDDSNGNPEFITVKLLLTHYHLSDQIPLLFENHIKKWTNIRVN